MAKDDDLTKKVIATLFSDVAISQPLYCPDLKTEADAEGLSDKLPLVYIWNENPSVGSFTVSVNGPIVGETLELFLSRENPTFGEIRDQIMETVRAVTTNSVMETCRNTNLLPSVAFSREAYIETCRHENSHDELKESALDPESKGISWGWLLLMLVFLVAVGRNLYYFIY